MKKITFLMFMLLSFAISGWGQIISQYVETSSGSTPKGIEIWNNTASELDFSANTLEIKKGTNGGAPSTDYTLSTGTLAAGDVIVIGTSDMQTETENNGAVFYVKAFTFNGDDALEVWYGATKTDVFGEPGVDPGSAWEGNGVSTANQNIQLLSGITTGDTDGWDDPSTRFETVCTDNCLTGFGIAPSGGGNPGPVITNIAHSPEFPQSSNTVYVQADVTDDSEVSTVNCLWSTTDGGPYTSISMELDAGTTYYTDSDIPAQADGTTVYYKIEATDDESETTTSGQQSYVVTDPATTTLPYSQTFDSDLGDCLPISVAGTNDWNWNAGGGDGYAQCNGYNGSNPEEEWLILPGINLDNYSNEVMQFYTSNQYGSDDENNYLKLYYSTDYSGAGSPADASWDELSYDNTGAWNIWFASGPVDISGISGTSVYFAFKYYSTNNPKLWRVDNITIFEGSTVDVTFQVNMAEESVSPNGIHVAGNFQGWDPATTELTDGDADDIYTVTLSIYSGVEYRFKYINGNTWPENEVVPVDCQAPGAADRFLVVGDTDYSLDVVCFSSCVDCGALNEYDITFRVNMQNETVSDDGVYLAGSFTNWGTGALPMTQNGNVWSLAVPLEETTFQEYKFVNGLPANGGWESDISNRTLTVPSQDSTLALVCFNSYDACPPPALFFSEIADPHDNTNARFVELYNASGNTINFDAVVWYVVKQVNGGNQYPFRLTGSVDDGNTFVIAGSESNFTTAYGFAPDQSNSQISGNGDDGYYLYIYGDQTSGTLVDAYGVLDEDGSNTAWDYEDTKAVRRRWVNAPSATWQSWEWNIPEDAGTLDMTPSAHKEDVTWVGTTDTDWNSKGDNWSDTFIPDASFNVTIPDVANQPIISYQAACNDLTINADASLDVDVTIFDIFGNLVVNSSKSRAEGAFTIGASETQNASVIVHTNATGNATVERYIQGYSEGADNGWHNISSPVNNMAIAGSDFAPGDNDDLYQWNEETNTWENYKQGHFANLENGMGYLNAFELSGTKTFVGTLNTEDVPVSGLSKDNDGFHLLGNPFASALRWDDGNWNLNNIGAVAQIWDESNNSYAQIAQYGTIPPTNGFFVEVSTAPGSLTIPKYARIHDIVGNYKNTETTVDLEETLIINLTNDENSYYDRCRVGFKDDANEEWDIQYDAHKLMGGSGTSQIWSVMSEEKFVFNYLPYVYEAYQLPLHFKAGVNATHHINVEGIEGFYINSEIYLEDLIAGETINLTEQQLYTFSASTSDETDRFVLHFFGGVTSTGDGTAAESCQIYSNNNTVYIKFDKLPESDFEISVFNTIGQVVYSTSKPADRLTSFSLNERPGIYIVQLRTFEGVQSQKVMIK